MLVKFLSIVITWIPANVIHAVILRRSKTRPYAAAVSAKELGAVRSTAAEILSRSEIEGLMRALQEARSGAPGLLLSQAGTIARLLQIEVRRYPMFFAKLLHAELLQMPKAKPYAEVVSTDMLGAVISTAAASLSDAEIEDLVRTTLLHTENPA
jgi:hypothetical protein